MASSLLGGIIGAAGGMSSGAAQGLAGILATKSARNWEEKMRASAWQTTVKDLEKAGLNPSLAFSQGPTTSHGVAPTQIPDFGSAIRGGIETGMATAKQGKALSDELATIRANRMTAEANAEYAPELARSEISKRYGDWYRSSAEVDLMKQQGLESQARTLATDVNRMLNTTELPGARAKERFDQTEFGQVMREVRRFLDAVPSLGGSFRSGASRGSGSINP